MLANESHYLCISMLLCTGGLVWERCAVCGWNSISVYHSHTPMFGLVLSLANAESPVWAYLTADCGEHWVFYPALPCPYFVLILILFPRTACTELKNMSAILETPPTGYAENKQCGASTQYSPCDDNFLMV